MRSLSPQPPRVQAASKLHLSETGSRRTYTLNEVADLFGVCQRTIRRRVQDGLFPPPLKLGRCVRFDAAAIHRFCDQ